LGQPWLLWCHGSRAPALPVFVLLTVTIFLGAFASKAPKKSAPMIKAIMSCVLDKAFAIGLSIGLVIAFVVIIINVVVVVVIVIRRRRSRTSRCRTLLFF